MNRYIKIPLEQIEILIARQMEIRNNLIARAMEELRKEYIDQTYVNELLQKAVYEMLDVDKNFMAVITLLKNAETAGEERDTPIIIEEGEDEGELFEGENEIIEKIEQLQESNPATYDYLKFIFEKGGKGFSSDFKDELGISRNAIYEHEDILREMGCINISTRSKGTGKRKFRYITIPDEVMVVLESLLNSEAGGEATPEYNMHEDEGVGEEWDE